MARNMLSAAAALTGFALLGTTLVALTHSATRDLIAANERAALLAGLNTLLAPQRYDNDLLADAVAVVAPQWLGTAEPVTLYRAYKNGRPVALLATVLAPDGYSGPITLLIGVYADGTLIGVRVLAHRETPGLGDPIEIGRSDWILSFTGRSLADPDPKGWAVKKDGGVFDQFTGATITPRAVVQAVRRFLQYFQHQRAQVFAASPLTRQESSHE